MTTPAPTHLRASGGAGGLDVHVDLLEAAARRLARAAVELARIDLDLHGVLLDPDLAAGAALAPLRAAEVATELAATLDGPHGLSEAGLRLAGRAGDLALAVGRYRTVDALDDRLLETRRWVTGAAVPVTVVAAAAGLAVAPAPVRRVAWAGRRWLPDADGLGRLAVEHPDGAEEVLGWAPGATSVLVSPVVAAPVLGGPFGGVLLAAGWPVLPRSTGELARLAGHLYPGARVRLVARGDGPPGSAPRSLADLVAGVAERDRTAHGQRQGDIDVRVLTGRSADGRATRSFVVDLPGTRDWQTTPLRARPFVNDLAESLQTMGSSPDARSVGVARALARVGARPDEPVLLVGHSQGGLVAMRAAQQLRASGRFHVTHVLALGAPTDALPVPPGVQVLSLKNRYDLVPRLDARAAPDQAARTTVTFDVQTGTVAGNHSLERSYQPAARAVDARLQDRTTSTLTTSVGAWEAGAAAFLDREGASGRTSRTAVFGIEVVDG